MGDGAMGPQRRPCSRPRNTRELCALANAYHPLPFAPTVGELRASGCSSTETRPCTDSSVLFLPSWAGGRQRQGLGQKGGGGSIARMRPLDQQSG